jgi:hypothetical protein
MSKSVSILIIVSAVIIGLFIKQVFLKNSTLQAQPIKTQELCSPESSTFTSTDFLKENQIVNIVGKYNSKTNELTDYDPHPCLEWLGEKQCRIIYHEDKKSIFNGKEFIYSELKSSSCPINVMKEFPNPGGYGVKKTCCLNDGDCSLLEGGSNLSSEVCSVIVESPKLEKACYTGAIELSKPISGVNNEEYVYVEGRLSPFFRVQPIEYKEQEKQHFVITADSYKKMEPFSTNSEQSITICMDYLKQNQDFINKYCSKNSFSCDLDNALNKIKQVPGWELVKFSISQKWLVSIPIGIKHVLNQDSELELNMVCQVNPYAGNVIEPTLCSKKDCIVCEP